MEIRKNRNAAEYIRGKAAIDPAAYRRLPSELRARALTVARVHDMDAIRDLIAKISTLPEGADWKKLRRSIAADISPYMDDNRVAARKKAELLLRTHGYQAYAAGRYQAQAATKEAVPYWMYITVGDNNVRDDHAALDGKVLPADDPFWQTHYPPWDFGCRCVVAGVTSQQAESIRAEDQQRPPAERRLLEGEALVKAREGRVSRGNGRGYADVRPPQERIGTSGYSWTPGRIAPKIAELKSRYSKEEWALFEKTMARDTVTTPDGRTVKVIDFMRS